MPQWLTQVSIIGQKIAYLDTLFRFCGQAAEIEKAYDNNKKERKYFTKILIQMHCLQIAVNARIKAIMYIEIAQGDVLWNRKYDLG